VPADWRDPRLLAAMCTARSTVVAVAGDIGHEEAVELAAAAFGTGNGVLPGYAAAPALPAGPRVLTGRRDTAQAQVAIAVPALRRDHPDAWTLAVLNVVLGAGMSSRLFLGVREEKGLAYDVSSGIVEYADSGRDFAVEVGPPPHAAYLEAILAELVRMADDPIPDEELAKAKAYLSGGLELRMDDTRHLASWIGGQEALHDRVFTLDEALESVEAVRSADVTRLATRAVHRRGAADGGRRPAQHLRGLEAPAAAAVTEVDEVTRDRVPADGRRSSLRLARVHLRLGSLSLARAELEALGNRDLLDDGPRKTLSVGMLKDVRRVARDLLRRLVHVGNADDASPRDRGAHDQPGSVACPPRWAPGPRPHLPPENALDPAGRGEPHVIQMEAVTAHPFEGAGNVQRKGDAARASTMNAALRLGSRSPRAGVRPGRRGRHRVAPRRTRHGAARGRRAAARRGPRTGRVIVAAVPTPRGTCEPAAGCLSRPTNRRRRWLRRSAGRLRPDDHPRPKRRHRA
jgi:hypothetical protein